jgi:hypothetical protein
VDVLMVPLAIELADNTPPTIVALLVIVPDNDEFTINPEVKVDVPMEALVIVVPEKVPELMVTLFNDVF